MRKLEALKVGGVQREEKRKIIHLLGWKAYFSSCYFLLIFLCTAKMISQATGSAPITF
jgi:hypothetical protein